jgi:glycosyltransferase involved in cell wall biosynthesis
VYECLALGIPFLLTKENYLSINKEDFVKIDPTSVDDIAEKMNALLHETTYKHFVESLEKLYFKRSWQDVILDHLKIFKKLV